MGGVCQVGGVFVHYSGCFGGALELVDAMAEKFQLSQNHMGSVQSLGHIPHKLKCQGIYIFKKNFSMW